MPEGSPARNRNSSKTKKVCQPSSIGCIYQPISEKSTTMQKSDSAEVTSPPKTKNTWAQSSF